MGICQHEVNIQSYIEKCSRKEPDFAPQGEDGAPQNQNPRSAFFNAFFPNPIYLLIYF